MIRQTRSQAIPKLAVLKSQAKALCRYLAGWARIGYRLKRTGCRKCDATAPPVSEIGRSLAPDVSEYLALTTGLSGADPEQTIISQVPGVSCPVMALLPGRIMPTKVLPGKTLIPPPASLGPGSLMRGPFACGGLILALLGYGVGGERRWLAVTCQQVNMPTLPPAWDGLRLVQLSDFHFGARGNPDGMVRRAVATAVALQPDLVLLTGDYSHHGTPVDLDVLRPLARAAPTFAVLGNHDFFDGVASADWIAATLADCGIMVLRNDMVDFVHNGAAGVISGFEQGGSGIAVDTGEMLRQVAERRPQIALVHEPDIVGHFPEGAVGLTLAGHTHGAQVRLSPVRGIDWIRWSPTECRSRYPRGWFTVRGNQLYVSRGLGVSGLPVRIGARPELATFVLRAAPPLVWR
jgi:predicted MPP superfamily phosphohydrolase